MVRAVVWVVVRVRARVALVGGFLQQRVPDCRGHVVGRVRIRASVAVSTLVRVVVSALVRVIVSVGVRVYAVSALGRIGVRGVGMVTGGGFPASGVVMVTRRGVALPAVGGVGGGLDGAGELGVARVAMATPLRLLDQPVRPRS